MYEQIISSVIDSCILVMEGFLAFYLLSELLPSADKGGQVCEDFEYDEHLDNDYYFEKFMAGNEFSIKKLQQIAKDNGVPGWSRMKKEDLSRELYNCALL